MKILMGHSDQQYTYVKGVWVGYGADDVFTDHEMIKKLSELNEADEYWEAYE